MISRSLLVSLISLQVAAGASTAFIQLTCTAPSFTLTPAGPSADFQVTCPQFNSALGQLTDVAAFMVDPWAFGSGSQIVLRNNTAGSVNIPQGIGPFSAALGPLPGGSAIGPGPGFIFVLSFGTLAPGSSQIVTPFATPGTPLQHAASDLSPYPGSGSVLIPVSISAPLSSPTLTVVTFNLAVQPNASIVYGYTPIPEPGTGTLAAALLVAAALRRFRAA